MYSSAYYKMAAREKLKGGYLAVFIGALILIIPQYLSYLISGMFNSNITAGLLISEGITIVIRVFVINLFFVGFYRMLAELKTDGEKKSCDYNTIFFAYSRNFKNTLKITFLREIKLLLWGIVALLPMIIAAVLIYVFVSFDSLKQLYGASQNFLNAQTPENLLALKNIMDSDFKHLTLFSLLYMAASIVSVIPFIYKNYEYIMIPMILADNPDMSSRAAFKKTKDIMHGFRMRYFMVQLSFILYQAAALLILAYSGFAMIYYIALAAIIPYQCMTYLEFYRQRNDVIEYNIEKYGEQ